MNFVAPSPSLTTSFAMSAMNSINICWKETKSFDCEVAEGSNSISVPPAAPFASMATMSLVEVSPSMEMQLYDLSAAVERNC